MAEGKRAVVVTTSFLIIHPANTGKFLNPKYYCGLTDDKDGFTYDVIIFDEAGDRVSRFAFWTCPVTCGSDLATCISKLGVTWHVRSP